MTEKKYIAICLVVAVTLVSLIAAANFIVNPFGIYGTPVIKGLNDYYPAANAFPRLHKIERVKRVKPEVVIIGSSRADSGLNPTAAFFGDARVYNFALSASTIYEQRRTLEFAQAVHPLRQAIITLDFFSFNGRRLENKQFDEAKLSAAALSPLRSFFDTYGTLAALDTFTTTLKHLRYIRKPERYGFSTENGFKNSRDIEYKIAQQGAGHRFASDPNEDAVRGESGFSFMYGDDPHNTTFRHLEAMLDFARQNRIDVILLMSPVHKASWKKMEQDGEMAAFLTWKKRIAAIVEADGRKHYTAPYPLWDFARLDTSYTTEPIPAADDVSGRMQWFYDSSHYKPALGDVIFRCILGKKEEAAEADKFCRRVL